MDEIYPIIVNNENIGELSVYKKGLLTFFEAESSMVSGILRISVYGEDGREGYLGVMAPAGEYLFLRKGLSRSAMIGFPDKISFAGPSGQKTEKEPPEEQPVAKPDERENEVSEFSSVKPEAAPDAKQNEGSRTERATGASTQITAHEDLLWFSTPEGKLMAFDGEKSLIALPVGDIRLPQGAEGELREIEGKKHLIFQFKNGKIYNSKTSSFQRY